MKNETVYLFYTFFSLVMAVIALLSRAPAIVTLACVTEAGIWAALMITEIEQNNHNNIQF